MQKLDKKNIEDVLALTQMQEGMLFHYLKNPESNHYFEQLSLEISGEINVEIFQKAWNFVIETNEMLRTVFRWEKLDKPAQVVLKQHDPDLVFFDLSAIENHVEQQKQLEKIKSEDRKVKFNLREVPFRVILCKLSDKDYHIVISNHHILYDGWSNGIILKEFFKAYNDFSAGKELLRSVKTRFREFVKWNQNRDLDEQEKFWRNYLKGFDTPTELTIKRRKGKDIPFTESFKTSFSRDLTGKIEDFVKNHKITLAAFLYSAWGILLQKYCNSGDVIFGTTVSGRSAPIKGIGDMVGLFINTIPLRVKTGTGEKIKDLLCKINNILLLRETYESTPLVDIKGNSELKNIEEIFSSIVVLENYPLDSNLKQQSRNRQLSVKSFSMLEMTNYDLTVTLSMSHDIEVNFIYNKELFDKEAIVRLSNHFTNILHLVCFENGVEKEIHTFDILSEAEKRELLFDFNNTEEEYPEEKTIHELFEEQVDKIPDNIGVIAQSIEERHAPLAVRHAITYRELNIRSNQLAFFLKEKGVGPDTIVPIMVERSFEMVVGIMGILKAGGAYLAIDPKYPEERIAYMLKDSSARILVSDRNDLETGHCPVPVFDLIHAIHCGMWNQRNQRMRKRTQPAPASVTSLAYVLYTSGSTGRPKGVLVQHRSVVNILLALFKKYPLLKEDTYLLKTTYTFDVSVSELFGWYLGGGRLAILEPGGEKNPLTILDWIERIGVTHINFVPSMFGVFLEILDPPKVSQLSSLKYIFLAGEVLAPHLVTRFNQFHTGILLENIYGPTENTIYTSQYSLLSWPAVGSIPIGKPLSNIQLYILNANDRLQPIGVSGELCIGGEGLARGYLNRPGLTAEKFKRAVIRHSSLVIGSSLKTNDRLYKTGDLARWQEDGNIEFLGRIDRQIKVRGVRIELGEIENQLLKHGEIREAVVLAREDEVGDRYLCAYIVPTLSPSNETFDVTGLRNDLLKFLPDYMIPSYFVRIDDVTLTPTGKIDRKALPKPEVKTIKKYIAPRNKREALLVDIWSRVLGIEKETIGIDDNFFELGGHSLKIAGLIGRIHKRLNIRVPFPEIFKIPTVRDLTEYLSKKRENKYCEILPMEEKEYYPLSSVQKRLYVLQQMDVDCTAYNMNGIVSIEGTIEKGKFEKVFRKLIARHESLQTSFHIRNGEPVQRIYRTVDFEIEYYQSFANGHRPSGKKEEQEIIDGFAGPFDLTRAPLLRVGMIKRAVNQYILLVCMHHIISDEVSLEVFIKDFSYLYQDKKPSPPVIQYKDFSNWRHKQSKAGCFKEQEAHWLKKFEGEMPVLNLPTDFTRPQIQSFVGNALEFEVGKEETAKLKAIALEKESTLFMVLLSLFNVFLAKVSNQHDIIVGFPVTGRKQVELRYVIGMFGNTLILINYPVGEINFCEFLGEVKENTLTAFENQEYPFEELVDKVTLSRDASRNPLFDVMFVRQNMNIGKLKIPGLKLEPYPYHNGTSKFDLVLSYGEVEESLYFTIDYCTKLFKQETIERFIRYFKKIVSDVSNNIEMKISQIEILSEKEKKQILSDFNRTEAKYRHDKTIHQLFEEHVVMAPDIIAVVFDDRQLTYRGLNEKSNQLAHVLVEKGVKTDSIVGIMFDRSIEMMVAIFGILKAGGAYLPIDPTYPFKRVKSMLEDCQASILLTKSTLIDESLYARRQGFRPGEVEPLLMLEKIIENNGKLPAEKTLNEIQGIAFIPGKNSSIKTHRMEIVMLDVYKERLSEKPIENLTSCVHPGNLAYMIFTSGSTGKPKGVLVEHRSLNNLICGFRDKIYKNDKEKLNICLISPYVFDASVKQIFGALLLGHKLYIVPEEARFAGLSLLEFYRRYRIDISDGTPVHIRLLLESIGGNASNVGVKLFIIGGEALPGKSVIDLFDRIGASGSRIVNVYGPTECCDVTNLHTVVRREITQHQYIPIGKLFGNMKAYILGLCQELQPIGIPGELYIVGIGLSRGYLNRPELTGEKFTASPFWQGERAYRTGDLVRWLPEGNIEYLGRIDQQVKIRGFRIELGETETQLLGYDGIKEAIVLLKEDEIGDKYLCAYFVADNEVNISELREFLLEDLPGYMIPSYFKQIEDVPLTSNGKVDRRALPEPDVKVGGKYTAPRDEIEEKLVELWWDVLFARNLQREPIHQLHTIGIDNNFFELGGNSLKVILLVSKIHKELDVKIPLGKIFEMPTIRRLAVFVKNAAKHKFFSIEMVETKEYYPLWSAQKRLYVLHQMDEQGIKYNIPFVLILEGGVDKDRLEDTFIRLINRHESLRTSFEMIEGEPVQRIHEEVKFEIEYYEISEAEVKVDIEIKTTHPAPLGAPSQEGNSQPETPNPKPVTRLIENFIRPFDLSHAPLLRVGLAETSNYTHLLLIDMHHIIADGISMGILAKEFMELYAGKDLPVLEVHYKDFSEWQNSEKEKERIKKQERFWLDEMGDEIPVLDLPIDFIRPPLQSFEGSTVDFTLNSPETEGLKKLATQEDATLFMILLGIFNIFLSKISSQEDILVGTPIAGRKDHDLQSIIGMFVNTLALRNYPGGNKTFTAWLRQLRAKTLEAFENQDYQFEDLVEAIVFERDTSRNPLFDTMFAMQNMEISKIELPGLTLNPYDYETGVSKFDLTLMAFDAGEKLLFTFEYCTKLFKQETIERFTHYFRQIVTSVLKDTGQEICEIDIIPGPEKQLLLYEFNDTAAGYPGDKTLHELFAEQAANTPDNVAVIGQSAGRRAQVADEGCALCAVRHALTYRELNEKADQLAQVLKDKGVMTDRIVAIMLERSIEMAIGIMGILKAGGAYLPIDPGYPEERIKYMLADSEAMFLLAAPGAEVKVKAEFEKSSRQPRGWVQQFINIKEVSLTSNRPPGVCRAPCVVRHASSKRSSNLAYIIYTSGSTGKPKGVLVEHFSVVNLAFSQKKRFKINEKDRILQFSSACFDASVEQIFIALFSGSVLVFIDKDTLLNNQRFEEFISSQSITHIHAVPSFLNNMNLKDTYQIKRIISGGDVCPIPLAKKLSGICDCEFYNEYGPTETTVTSIEMMFEQVDEALPLLPIGKPIDNTTVYLFDREMKVVPIGVVGELYIGGEGVTRGYLNRPELTAEKFVRVVTRHSLSVIRYHGKLSKVPNDQGLMTNDRSSKLFPNDRLYRTGDLARWLPDGIIEFLGRVDHQIKLRGFRIELGEIESQLLSHGQIKEAVVLFNEDGTGEKYICAYIVPDGEGRIEKKIDELELKEYLAKYLPDYMNPSYIVQLDEIPLTTTGKIDRRAMSELKMRTVGIYTAPRDEIERKLADLWTEVLLMSAPIGIDDDFFRLGGHSLKATVLVSKINKILHAKLTLVDIFKRPTIRRFSEYIKKAIKEKYIPIKLTEEKEYYVLSSAQERLYFLRQMDDANTVYNISSVWKLEGVVDKDRLGDTFKQLIRRHESLRTSFEIVGEEPVQRIHDEVDFEIEFYDLATEGIEEGRVEGWKGRRVENKEVPFGQVLDTFGEVTQKEVETHHSSFIIHHFVRPFDLSRAPLLRVGFISTSLTDGYDTSLLLIVDMHHIISDGISSRVLIQDFKTIYTGEKLLEVKLKYKDYAEWQNGEKKQEAIKQQEEYWLREFGIQEEIPVLELPTDYLRPAIQSFEGHTVQFSLDNEVKLALKQLGIKEEVTLYMLLLAICYVWVAKISRQEDIIVGLTTAGRRNPDLENIIGIFINTLAMRTYPTSTKTFKTFLHEVKEKTLEAFDNQDYPFGDLVSNVVKERDLSRSPLFDVAFGMWTEDSPFGLKPEKLEIPELTLSEWRYEREIAKFDLFLFVEEKENDLEFKLEYCTKLFKPQTIEIFISYYKRIVLEILEDIDREIKELEIISEEEKSEILSLIEIKEADIQADFEI